MEVRFVSLSNDRARKRYWDHLEVPLGIAAFGDEFKRVAFGGKTARGRSGIVIDLYGSKVSGHKIEAIPKQLVNLVRHVPLASAREAFGHLLNGEDVLIGEPSHGLLIKRYGDRLEVFGAGDDSNLPLLL